MFQPDYTDCPNCGTTDHNDYDCPCGCHGDEAPSRARQCAMTRKPFRTWLEVRHHCETHAWVYYQAPLDTHPVVACPVRIFKNGKIRLAYHDARWTADESHLERFSQTAIALLDSMIAEQQS